MYVPLLGQTYQPIFAKMLLELILERWKSTPKIE